VLALLDLVSMNRNGTRIVDTEQVHTVAGKLLTAGIFKHGIADATKAVAKFNAGELDMCFNPGTFNAVYSLDRFL
jgi:glutamate mutase epsilon subunit